MTFNDRTPVGALQTADRRTFHSTLFHSCVALLALYALAVIALAATDGHRDAMNAVLGLAALSASIGIEMRQ